jgi:hypothetical protein
MENQQQSSGGGGRKPWAAYNLIERGDRTIWSRVGSAFKNHDGSWNIFLDSVPLGGKIQIREVAEDREKRLGEKGQLAASTERVEA